MLLQFRTLLHLGSFITFRPYTPGVNFVFLFSPVNFLRGRHNRFTIAATFGATASTCMELFFSGKSGIFIEGGPPWVKGKYGTSLPDP